MRRSAVDPLKRKRAERMLRQGYSQADVRRATGLSRDYLCKLARKIADEKDGKGKKP